MSGRPRLAIVLSCALGFAAVASVAIALAALSGDASRPAHADVRSLRVAPPPEPRPSTRATVAPTQPPDPAAAKPVAAPRALPSLATPPITIDPPALELPGVEVPPPAFAIDLSGTPIDRPAPPAVRPGGDVDTGSGESASPPQGIDVAIPAVLIVGLDLERHYPRAARRAGIGGATTVVISISDRGEVTAVRVTASSPAGYFESAAESACRELQFQPATQNGHAVASAITLEIVWTVN
jgi:protein TonB